MNPIESIRNTLTRREAERRETAIEEYGRLVRDLGDDSPRDDHDEIEAILRETGKTVDDLAEDVADLRQRRQWAEQLGPRAGLIRERDELQAQVDEAAQAVQRAREAHTELAESLRPQITEIEARIAQLDGIRTKLGKANMEARRRGVDAVEAP